MIDALLCVRRQTLFLADVELLRQCECLSVCVLFSACFYAGLRGH